jgi:hypothetical protein
LHIITKPKEKIVAKIYIILSIFGGMTLLSPCIVPCQEAIEIYPATRGQEFHDNNPVWSPDGYILAFERLPQTGGGIHKIFFIQPFFINQVTQIRHLADFQSTSETPELLFASYLSWTVRNNKEYTLYYCAYMNQTNLHVGRVKRRKVDNRFSVNT